MSDISNLSSEIELKYLRSEGNLKISLISDFKFRNISLETQEFGGFALHIDQPLVPENELWISKFTQPVEIEYYTQNALKQIEFMSQGLDATTAYERSLEHEKELRAKSEIFRFNPNLPKNEIPKELYSEELTNVLDKKVKVFKVDGRIVRDIFKTDYIEGGHAYVYPWIPVDEIWLEKDIDNDEYPFVLIHEMIERTLMKLSKFKYDDGHDVARKVEFKFRKEGLTLNQVDNFDEKENLKQAASFLLT